MTVVPCLADQPLRTGQPRRTGAPPEPGESAVLVRAPQPRQLGRECEPEPAPRARGAAKREKAAHPAEGTQRGAAAASNVAKPDPAASSAAELAWLGDAAASDAIKPDPAASGAAELALSGVAAASNVAKPDSAASGAAELAWLGDAAASDAVKPNRAASSAAGLARLGDAAASDAIKPDPAASNAADRPKPGNGVATEAVGSDAKATAAASNAPEPPHPADPQHPDPDHPSRVRVVVDWDPFSRPPRRIATRDEMLASAHRVLARRKHGRHRKPDTRDPWATRAADFVVTWASTLRMALLLLAGTAFLTGLVLMNSPIAGVAVTSVTLAAGVAAWVARPRRSPSHRC